MFGPNTTDYGPLYYGLVRALRPKVIVETGVLHGYTTAWIAAGAQETGAEFYAIDNFSESNRQTTVDSLSRCGVSESISLLCGDSIEILTHLSDEGKLQDLGMAVFDDEHTYERVNKEMSIIWPHLTDGGVAGGHDCQNEDWPGVNRAYVEWAERPDATFLWFPKFCGVVFFQKILE
jgi:predicted O-methyltransferase YrrM